MFYIPILAIMNSIFVAIAEVANLILLFYGKTALDYFRLWVGL